MKIDGRVVLVTGGSAGIGRELVRQMAGKGARVIVTGRDKARLDEVAAAHPDIVTYRVDFSNRDAVDQFIAAVSAAHPDLSLVINNAGVQTEMDIVNAVARLQEVREEIAVNFDAVVSLTIGLLPVVAARGGGAIVNVTSGLAIAPKEASPVYCAAKAGIRSFTKAMRYQCELRAPNVHVIEVVMALVDTGMTSGRGRGKISPAKAARGVVRGIERGDDEIWIGKSKLLRVLNRLSPKLVERIMR